MATDPNDDIGVMLYLRINTMVGAMVKEAMAQPTSESRRRYIAGILNGMTMGTASLIGFMSSGDPKQAAQLSEVAVQHIYEHAAVGQREMADIMVKIGGKT